MNILNKIKSLFTTTPTKRNFNYRAYKAAKFDPYNKSMPMDSANQNVEIHQALRILRARARELEQNDDYAKGFLRLLKTQVIGNYGIRLQSKVKKNNNEYDTSINEIVENIWNRWAKVGNCDVTKKLSFIDIQNLFLTTIAKDGEVLIRVIEGYDNPFNFALQFIPVEYLDDKYNTILENGNKVIMGIEMDGWGCPVAYYILQSNNLYDVFNYAPAERIRVPATEIIHEFITDNPTQIRGVTWFHTALMRLRNLNGYEEAEMVAARISAAKMGFIEMNAEGEYRGDGESEDEYDREEVSPGEIDILPNGAKFSSFDPQHPVSAYESFVKAILRGVAVGLGASYSSLTSDLSDTNYASMRDGKMTERDHWKYLQRFVIEHFNQRIFERFMRLQLLNGNINIPYAKLNKVIDSVVWQPRGYPMVDPAKETTSNLKAIEGGIKTKAQVIAQEGGDYEEVVNQLKFEKEFELKAGLKEEVEEINKEVAK